MFSPIQILINKTRGANVDTKKEVFLHFCYTWYIYVEKCSCRLLFFQNIGLMLKLNLEKFLFHRLKIARIPFPIKDLKNSSLK